MFVTAVPRTLLGCYSYIFLLTGTKDNTGPTEVIHKHDPINNVLSYKQQTEMLI